MNILQQKCLKNLIKGGVNQISVSFPDLDGNNITEYGSYGQGGAKTFRSLDQILDHCNFSSSELESFFFLAVRSSTPAIVCSFLNYDISLIDCVDQSTRTPLMLATRLNKLEMVTGLLKQGADPYITDKAGRIPLDYATGECRAALLERTQESRVSLSHGLLSMSRSAVVHGEDEISRNCMRGAAKVGNKDAQQIVNSFNYSESSAPSAPDKSVAVSSSIHTLHGRPSYKTDLSSDILPLDAEEKSVNLPSQSPH